MGPTQATAPHAMAANQETDARKQRASARAKALDRDMQSIHHRGERWPSFKI